MDKDVKLMNYNEFARYCNDRACDGNWKSDRALMYIKAIENINKIQIKRFGITMKKKTEQVREDAWQTIKKLF